MPGTLKRGFGTFRQQVRSTEPHGDSFEHVTWSTRKGFRWSVVALEILASLWRQGRWGSHRSHHEQINWIPDSVHTNYVIFTFVKCCYHSYTSHIFIYISRLALLIMYHLICCRRASYLSRWQDIVHVLQKRLIFDFIVCKDEGDAFALLASNSVQVL